MNKRQKRKRIKSRNIRLVSRYPFLFPRNVWTDEFPKDYDLTYTKYDCLPKGWQIGFGEFLLEDLREACEKTYYLYELRIMDWKEKYGGMRLYVNGAPQKVHDVIQKYEFISEFICMKCGSPHAFNVDNYGWWMPTCKECWEKQNKKREEKGYRTVSWEEVINEECKELPNSYTFTTYSKDGNIETTVDISDTVDKIRKKYEKRQKKKRSK